jgi:tRNA-dihydrouridine synthase B
VNSRLSPLGVTFPFFVAPMVGLSHVGLRELVRYYTPTRLRPLLFTEMLSTRRLPSESMQTTAQARVAPGDRGLVIPQILGNDERYIAPSLAKLQELDPWGIDINMGCPVTHTLKHNWGFRLVGQPEYAAGVVAVTKKHSKVPVSVKLRGDTGVLALADLEQQSHGSLFPESAADLLAGFVRRLADAGADWVTIHPRPGRVKHRGAADWALVAAVRHRVGIPVVANGDIQTAQDALHVVSELGCDGAMFARAICARPWLLWQTARALGVVDHPELVKHRSEPPTIGVDEGQEYMHAVQRLISVLVSFGFEDSDVVDRVRFFCATGSRWYQFGHDFWRVTTKAKSVAALRDAVDDYARRCVNPSISRVNFL